MSELVKSTNIDPTKIFTEKNVDNVLHAIKQEVSKFVPDISTNVGRKDIASMANKIARSKTYLDNLGKDLVSDWKKKSKLVDMERKRIREELDQLKIDIRHPLTEWENKQKEKEAAVVELMNKAKSFRQEYSIQSSSEDICLGLKHLKSLRAPAFIDEFEQQKIEIEKEIEYSSS